MTTYSISLDDVDLALLPLYTHTYNNFLKREYYQFEVMRTETNEESVPTVYYKCHICAIQVPAAFASEHAASVKHRANARIASVAVERTRGLITALPPPHIQQPNTLFCANCSLLVDKNHEKTKEHRVAVLHDKLLSDLMAAYVGDDDDDIKNEDALKPNYTEDLISEKKEDKDINVSEVTHHSIDNASEINEMISENKENKYINVCEIEVNHIDNASEVNDNGEVINETNSPFVNAFDKQDEHRDEIKDKIEVNCNGHNRNELIYYNEIHTQNQFQPLDKDVTTDFEIVDIEDKDHKEPTTIEKNINGETETNNNSIRLPFFPNPYPIDAFPKLTNKTNNMTMNYEAKANKVEHVEFVTKDNKYVKIHSDHYHGFIRRERRTECILCDVSFKSEELNSHLFSVRHLNMIPSTMINKHCMRTINVNYSHCLFCNQKIKTANVSKHLLTTAHSEKQRQGTLKLEGRKLASIHLKCNTDKYEPKEVKAKIDVTKKLVKVTKNLKENPAIKGVASADWPVIYPYEMATQDGSVYCVICGCSVPNNPDNRKSHLLGLNHVTNVRNKRTYSYEATDEETVVRCVVCDVKVWNTTMERSHHLITFIHSKNLNDKECVKMATYSIVLDDLDLALLPRRTFTNDFLKREFFQFQVIGAEAAGDSSATVYYKCHICAIKVPAAFASEHAASVKHKANARIASVAVERTRGLITALPPPHAERPNGSFCESCSLIVDRNHTRSKQHRIAVNEDKMLWELMTVYVGDDADDDDKKGDDSESKLSDLEDLTTSEKRNDATEIVDTKAFNDYKQFKIEDSESELGHLEDLTTSEKTNEVTNIFDTKDHNDYKQFQTDVVNGVLPKRRKRTRPKKRGKKQSKEVEEVEYTNEIDHQDVQNNDDNRVNETDHSNTNCEATSVEIEAQINSKISTNMKKTDSDLTLIDEINDKTEISDTNELEEIEDDVNNSSATRENCNTNTQSKKMEPVYVQSDGNKGDENDNSNTNSDNTSVTSETHTSYEYFQCPSTDTNSEDLNLELTTDEIDIADTSYNKALEEIDNFNNTSETHEKCDDSTQLEKEHEVDEIDKQAHVQDKVDKDSKIDDINTTTETTVIETEKGISKRRYSIDACNQIRNDMAMNERVPIIVSTTESVNDVYADFVPDGNKFVRCLSDHYHDFIVKVGKVECKKCNCAFNCGEPLSRAFSMRHSCPPNPPMIGDSLFPPFTRKPVTEPTEYTGVRKLSETYSQCYVCKNVLRNNNVATHILTARHQTKLKEAASAKNDNSDRQTVTIANTDKQLAKKTAEHNATTANEAKNKLNTTVETDFEVNFDKWWKTIEELIFKQKIYKLKNEGLDKVENTSDTTTAGSSDVSNNAEPKPGTSGLKLSIKYPYEATDKESVVRCVICDCLVPNTQENRKGHLDGSKHAQNVGMNKPSFPYVATTQEAFVRCVVCNYNVPNDTKKKKGHLYGTTHANNAKKKEVSYPFEATKQESVLRCVVCDCRVPNTPENKEGHLAGSNHASNLKAKGNSYPYEATKQESVLRCVVCNCKVPNTPENRKDHLLGSRHSSNVVNVEAKNGRAS